MTSEGGFHAAPIVTILPGTPSLAAVLHIRRIDADDVDIYSKPRNARPDLILTGGFCTAVFHRARTPMATVCQRPGSVIWILRGLHRRTSVPTRPSVLVETFFPHETDRFGET